MTSPPTQQTHGESPTLGSLLESTLSLLNTTAEEVAFDNVSEDATWQGHNASAEGEENKVSAVVPHLFPAFQVLITIFYIFGIGGNISALYFIKKSETQRNRKQTLMLRCLALNDLVALMGSFVLMNMHLYLPVANSRWFCMLRVIWRAFGLGSGCVALVMALERWLSLTHPFTYQRHVTHTVIWRSIVGLWTFNLVLVCAPFFGFGLWYDEEAEGFTPCVRYRFATTPVDKAYAYLVFAFGMIMCSVIVCCNMAVIRVLCMMRERKMPRRHSGTSCRSISSTSDSKMNHATIEELSFARLMAVLSIFFVICWVPQLLTIVVAQLHGSDKQFDKVYRIADIFIALNFTLDPYMYVLFRRHQRCGSRHLRKLRAYLCPQRRHESPTRALINGSVRSSSHNSNNSTGSTRCKLPTLREHSGNVKGRMEVTRAGRPQRPPTYRVLRKSTSLYSSSCPPRPPPTMYTASSSLPLPSESSELTAPANPRVKEIGEAIHEAPELAMDVKENDEASVVLGETKLNSPEVADDASEYQDPRSGLQTTKSWFALSQNDPNYASDADSDSEDTVPRSSKRWSFCYGQESSRTTLQTEYTRQDFKRKFWLLESWYHLVPRMKSHENLWLKRVKFTA